MISDFTCFFQDIIRASVVQDKNPQPITSTGPPLVIKLPTPTPQIEVKSSLPLAAPQVSNDSNVEEEEEDDEEDDWDTFQSFPASGNETAPAPESSPSISGHNSGEEDSAEKGTSSLSPVNNESFNDENHESGEAASTSFIEADGNNQIEDSHRPEDDSINHQESTELSQGADAELPNIQSDQVEDEHTDPSGDQAKDKHTDPSAMVPDKDNIETDQDVQRTDSTNSDNQSDEHISEKASNPTESSAEPSNEEKNNIDPNISVVSTNDSEETSTADDSNSEQHEKVSNEYEQSSLSPIDDSENNATKSEGKH